MVSLLSNNLIFSKGEREGERGREREKVRGLRPDRDVVEQKRPENCLWVDREVLKCRHLVSNCTLH